jgi:diguanylate cyclase
MQSKSRGAFNFQLHEVLAEALAGNPATAGFEVHYQPIVRFDDKATMAVEALASWNHPVAGKIEPVQFVAAAERTGLMGVLDDFVLNRACADAGTLAAAYGREIGMHVNVSASRLGRKDLEAAIGWALQRHKLPAGRLTIEITESGLIEDLSVAAASLQRIRDRGVQVALDNFGSGFNPLVQLQGLPIDLVKLDVTLTNADAEFWRTEEMCRSALEACRRLGVGAIAEGVETLRQACALQDIGCQMGQGILYGAPSRLTPAGKQPPQNVQERRGA